MMYSVLLRKEKTYWWDEDGVGKCAFSAGNDEMALKFVATVVRSMNRKYGRMNERRNVFVDQLTCVTEGENGLAERSINIKGNINNFSIDKEDIRKTIKQFYPKKGNRYSSIMHMFCSFREVPHPHLH